MPLSAKEQPYQFYYQTGKGTPLMLLSGLGGDHQSVWSPCFEELEKRFCVIAVDPRNTGKSEFIDKPFTIADMAEDIRKLANELGIEKMHLAGFSMGGLVAQQFAKTYPDRVERLVLACTYATMNNRNHLFMEGVREAYQQSQSLQTIFDLVYPVLFRPRYYDDLENGKNRVLLPPEELEEPFFGWLRLYQAQAQFDSREWVSQIRAPTLVVGGSEDFFVPVPDLRFLATEIPKAKLELLEDCGHMPSFEQYQSFIQAILDFLT